MKNKKERIIRALTHTSVASLLTKLVGDFVPIFMLHRIENSDLGIRGHSEKFIVDCLEYIRREQYQAISLQNLCKIIVEEKQLPKRSVVFTIDDGFTDQIGHGGELFARYDIPLTCFVVTDFLDGHLWPWDDQIDYVLRNTQKKSFSLPYPDTQLCEIKIDDTVDVKALIKKVRERLKACDQSDLYAWLLQFYAQADVEPPMRPPANCTPCTWEDARQFQEKGHDIAAHTMTHRILSRLNEEEAFREIRDSVVRVREMLPDAANVFAFPTGRAQDYSEREGKILHELGVLGAVTTSPVAVRVDEPIYTLPRYSFPFDMGNFIQYLSFIETLKSRLRGIL